MDAPDALRLSLGDFDCGKAIGVSNRLDPQPLVVRWLLNRRHKLLLLPSDLMGGSDGGDE
jgi:hypothetical protein